MNPAWLLGEPVPDDVQLTPEQRELIAHSEQEREKMRAAGVPVVLVRRREAEDLDYINADPPGRRGTLLVRLSAKDGREELRGE